MNTPKEFTPALGKAAFTPLYDLAIAWLTREQHWRGALVRQVGPRPGQRILDVGCGTGSLAIRLKAYAPEAEIVGLDPDPAVLARARIKPNADRIVWREGFLTEELAETLGPFASIVSSLVFHQTPLDEKSRILVLMHRALREGGSLHVADYGLQRTALMRFLFRRTVQQLDGVADTQPNADGVLPRLIEQAGFHSVEETVVIPTFTGSISFYRGVK